MLLTEHRATVHIPPSFEAIEEALRTSPELPRHFSPVRFVVTRSDDREWQCEIGGLACDHPKERGSIFRFRKRTFESHDAFTTVLLVPTGIGAEIGGHAGDAGPVAKLIGQVSDRLILHPNVVNASDINEMPPNSLYVEGSVICRLLMGTVGLQPVHSNRLLVVIDEHKHKLFKHAAINAVNGARSSYGIDCKEVVCLDPPIRLRARFAESGRAAGRVEGIDSLLDVLNAKRAAYDAVAVASVIDVPHEYHQGYFDAKGEMVNPWGGVEAMLTHCLSMILDVPSAHSPMFENSEIADMDPGIVDPRMAAEAVSTTFLNCTLKGLQQSPKLIKNESAMDSSSVVSAKDVSCLVIPDGCLGLPVLAALEQGIKVIAVGENSNLMQNDLACLQWNDGQLIRVANYWEAAGVIAAIRAGIVPKSVRRPFPYTRVSIVTTTRHNDRPEASAPLLETKD